MRRRLRHAIAANATIMLLEVATVVITLLKVFSDMRRPAGADVARLRREAAFGVLSACSTIAGFCVGAVGMRKLVVLLKAAAHSARSRASSTTRSPVPPTGSTRNIVCLVNDTEAACCASVQLKGHIEVSIASVSPPEPTS